MKYLYTILVSLVVGLVSCGKNEQANGTTASQVEKAPAPVQQQPAPTATVKLNPPPAVPNMPLAWLSENMVTVDAGSFMMGCLEKDDACCLLDNEPVHKVAISSFMVCKHETTQSLWMAVMKSNPSEHKDCPMCPVEMVNWDDVQLFIKKLNQMTKKKYRLLSEAEWEFVAKGGSKRSGFCYAGSNNADKVCWHDKNSKSSQLVGLLQPNELGIHDMSGNVCEWVQDVWHDDYTGAPANGEAWMKGGDDSARILKGGDWYTGKTGCAVSDREGEDKLLRDNTVGFRLAHDL